MPPQRVENVFSPRCADFEAFWKLQNPVDWTRGGLFAPPHTPPLPCPGHLQRGFWQSRGGTCRPIL